MRQHVAFEFREDVFDALTFERQGFVEERFEFRRVSSRADGRVFERACVVRDYLDGGATDALVLFGERERGVAVFRL